MNIADALWPKTRQRVLGVLFGTPDRSFFANEVIALARSGTGAVQRELTDLTAAGLLTRRRIGNQTHYQANAASPVFAELRGLVLKTAGLADVVRAALLPMSDRVRLAFIHGSLAGGSDTAQSDVDLVVVADTLGYGELMLALDPAAAQLGRPIHPALYSPGEWAQHLAQDRAFLNRVRHRPTVWLMGEEARGFEHESGQPERPGPPAESGTP